jgi:hypothetical protein
LNYFEGPDGTAGAFFIMKNFVYLRINAIVGIVASLALFALALSYTILTKHKNPYPKAVLVLILLAIFGMPVFHNLLIIHIYRKYYPAKEIPKFSRILNVVCSIWCLIQLLFWLAGFYFKTPDLDFHIERIFITFVIFMIYLITLLIQVTGSFRLVKKVKSGASLQLESSFV